MKAFTVAFVLVSTLAACRVTGQRQLAPRASFDLGCTIDEAQITEISSTSYGVEGCGCRATYVTEPANADQVWVLNSVSGESCKVLLNKRASN